MLCNFKLRAKTNIGTFFTPGEVFSKSYALEQNEPALHFYVHLSGPDTVNKCVTASRKCTQQLIARQLCLAIKFMLICQTHTILSAYLAVILGKIKRGTVFSVRE